MNLITPSVNPKCSLSLVVIGYVRAPPFMKVMNIYILFSNRIASWILRMELLERDFIRVISFPRYLFYFSVSMSTYFMATSRSVSLSLHLYT